MPTSLNLTNQRFGRLTALYKAPSKSGKTYWVCQCDCGTLKEVQTSHLTRGNIQSCGCLKNNNSSLMASITDENFIEIVKQSNSYADVVRKCGYSNISGASEKIIKDRIQMLNLNTEHFHKIQPSVLSDKEIFVINSTVSQATLRRRYEKGKYSDYICAICHQKPYWNNKPLVLTLDHINGNNHDDRLENLRWVCPNCDRQLDTFAGRNRVNEK